MTVRRSLRIAAVLPLVALGVTACTSSAAPKPHAAATCSASATGPLVGGPTGTIQVPAHSGDHGQHVDAELLRVDPATGAVVARCAGADTTTSVEPGGSLVSHQRIETLAAATGTVLPAFDNSADDVAATATAVVNRRTGARTAMRLAGWHVVAVISRGVLMQSDASSRAGTSGYVTTPTTADDFCVLPPTGAAGAGCAPVPGAAGSGFPWVRTDGSVGWVAARLVPATFGSVHGYALTDGRGVLAFATSRTQFDEPTSYDQWYRPSLDGRALLDARPDSSATIRWMTVDRVDASGVHGTLHVSAVPRRRFQLGGVGSHGFVVSADGRTLHVLDDDVTVGADRANLTLWTATEGSSSVSRLTVHAPARDALGGAGSSLISWPGTAPAA